MAQTYTPSINTDPTKAILGEKSSAVLALQKQLNQQNAGVAGYVPLKEDSLYGPLTQAATQFKAPVPVNTPSATNPNNPVITSINTRSTNDAIINDVNALTASHNDSSKLLQDRIDALEQRRKDEVASIKASYESALAEQGIRQKQDYAGKSTNLVTAGGGFLGMTGSQSGVLENLSHTFETEKTALLAKRDAAIREAQNAIDDKQFALAKSKADEARQYEQDLFNRQKDVADQKLALARESRAQSEYDRNYTDERLKAYSSLPEAEFNKLTPNQIGEVDKYYYPGYTKAAREINSKINAGKNLKDNVALLNDIQDLINKTPAGKKITLADGTTYVGQKKTAGTGTNTGYISPLIVSQIPALAGLAGHKEKEIILSLELPTAPAWYKTYYANSAPEAYAQIKDNPNAINGDWDIFRNLPDLMAYRNTVKLDMRHSINSGADDVSSLIDSLSK